MTAPWQPKRPTVELRPSKIRREPPPPPSGKPSMLRLPTEDESWAVALGVLAFAIAFTYLIFWISDYTSPTIGEPKKIVAEDSI
jgi:hypothetical protein